MAMATAMQQAFHAPSVSLSCNLATGSPLSSSQKNACLYPRLRSSCFSFHSHSFGLRGLDNTFLARHQRRRLFVRRVVACDATTTQAEVDDSVEYVAAADDSVEYVAADSLTMYIKMEGTLRDTTGSKISKTLEGMEGVSNVKVLLEEGMATVELTKKTNIQATGVASELVDAAQKSGFKLQSLCLGFDDEETTEDDASYFSSSSAIDESEIAAV